ncbi:MAG: ABC transporter ATP-binding protein [Lachnospiraceae bacterium]|nr:ABC transporter ATP-binding protein [Lachnospiraceae bacterium]MDE7239167.1 ABC transporter ATP-binding protein [Lachnospiraceae bacterium]
MSLIELKNAVKEYTPGEITVRALDELSLGVQQGEIIVILGQSGSGKSTLLNIMGGLDVLTSGEILLEGKPYTNFKDAEMSKLRRQKFGFIFQAYNLLPLLTIYENIIAPLLLDNKRVQRKDVEALSESLGIKEQLDKFPNQLSGGQQQRAAIVRALINQPKVIFADEPTGNLDKDTGEQVMSCLIDAVKKEGATLVMVTHNEKLSSYADRVIRMESGKEIGQK